MKTISKRVLLAVILVGVYFGLWRDFRGVVTQNITIPIIENATEKSNQFINYYSVKPTSTVVYFYDASNEEYDQYLYTTPAGFYFLLGMLIVAFLDGGKFYYKLVIYFNLSLWLLSIISIWIGLLYVEIIFHIALVNTKYILQAFTFIVLALLISPNFRQVLRIPEEL